MLYFIVTPTISNYNIFFIYLQREGKSGIILKKKTARVKRLPVGKEVSALKFHYEKSIYFRWGVTAFLTVVAILAVYDIFFGMHKIAGYLDFLGGIVTPVVYGGAIAYLLAPIVDFLERTLLRSWAGP